MGTKEDLLAELVRKDPSGSTENIHARLIGHGLKWKGPANSKTLLYYFRSDGREIGVAAMRVSMFSFPAAFWQSRGTLLARAREMVPEDCWVRPEPAISSSQYSAGQIRIRHTTCGSIEEIIESIVIPEARCSGAQLT